jgi:hypothetical protein
MNLKDQECYEDYFFFFLNRTNPPAATTTTTHAMIAMADEPPLDLEGRFGISVYIHCILFWLRLVLGNRNI